MQTGTALNPLPTLQRKREGPRFARALTKQIVFDWLDFLIDQLQGAGFLCSRGGLCVRKGYVEIKENINIQNLFSV